MRVLFSAVGQFGHVLPLLPLAGAFRDAGHDVAFATAGAFRERLVAAGFEFHAAGPEPRDIEARAAPLRAQVETLPYEDRRPVLFTTRFARLEAPEKLPAVLRVVREWQPDLLVHESCDLAAPLAAAALDVPSAHQSFGRVVPQACWDRAAPEVAPLWRDAGLHPDPLCGAFRGVYVDICPPSVQTNDVPGDPPVQLLRPSYPSAAGEEPPPWLDELPTRPTVYVTLGTVFNATVVFRTILDALAGEDVNVVVTIGNNNDPAELEPIPQNAHDERCVSQAFLLPRADVTIGHGGSGSTLAALAHGLPMLLLPRGADQFENARRCADLGAARVLLPDAVTRDAVRDAVRALLADGAYAGQARAVAAEIAAMPAPSEVATRLLAAAH